MSAIARTAWPALLSFTLIGIGCGQQEGVHSSTAPETNASSDTPTPATSTASEAPSIVPVPQKDNTATIPALPSAPDQVTTPVPALPASLASAKEESGVSLEKVNYEAFLKRIAENPNKPRYTVVDAWATWCGPCKENFPHLVEMNTKYGDKGVAFASISFDDPAEAKQVEDAKVFLAQSKASFRNYLLDEEPGVGFEKFGVNAIPAVFVYGPDGKEVKRFTMDDPNNQFTYDEVEKEVVALIGGKAGNGQ